ncbi:MAG TPA: sigma-70 family RNA polymerase sigma factor [Acidimicrobiales bacterium]|nr:sigma-70 family RNA polymerase sigma factor [Acidimicrobiales bacterium]
MTTTGPDHDVVLDWDAVFRQYGPAVRAFVRPRVPPACVDDAVQDTFERAFRSRHRFDVSRPVWPWLVTIAKRACMEARRRHPAETVVDLRDDGAVTYADPHFELERRMQASAISQALDGLTPRHRRLLVGWEIEGRAFESLAAEEGLTRQALKSAICRARNGFRQGYASVVERTGLAAFAFGRLLGRIRDRVQAMAPGADALIGGVVVGMATAVALLAAGPIDSSAATQRDHAGTTRSPSDAAPRLDVPMPFGAGSLGGTGGVASEPPGTMPPDPGAPGRTLVPSAGGSADVAVTPNGTVGLVSVHWQDDTVGGSLQVEVGIKCSGRTSDAVCMVARSVPRPLS